MANVVINHLYTTVHIYIGVLVSVLALYFWGYIGTIFKICLYSIAILIGLGFGIRSTLFTKRKYELTYRSHYNNPLLSKMLTDDFKNREQLKTNARTPTLVSRNVDDVIKDIIRYVIRDYIEYWYKDMVMDQNRMYKKLKSEIWIVLANFKERLKKMDDVKFFTNDIVIKMHQHFQKIPYISGGTPVTTGGEQTVIGQDAFELSEFLENPEKEMEHLRGIMDFLLVLILPSKYAHCQTLRHLLREILACLVFYPAIEMICDPDFVNLKLLAYLQYQQKKLKNEANPYFYKDFKDFVQIINKTGDVKSLEFMRKCIITEIMHATTINSLKRAKGMDADKEFSPESTDKGDLLKARNLNIYINQLKFAKNLCEKQIKSLGNLGNNGASISSGNINEPGSSTGQTSSNSEQNSTSPMMLPGKTVLAFSIIMQSGRFRRYFSEHLNKHEQKSLLSFWEMVQEMRTADKTFKHQLGNEIIQIYVNNPKSVVKLPKNILKGMESYMMANTGPEAFFQAQEDIYKIMEERFYPTFIVSTLYNTMLDRAEKNGVDFATGVKDKDKIDLELLEEQQSLIATGGTGDMTLSSHSSLATCLLNQTVDKLNDKKQALSTFLQSGTDSKMVPLLEKEISELETDVAELGCYTERTTFWINYLGYWEASIVNLKIREHERPIDVDMFIQPNRNQSSSSSKTINWQVSRTISEFHDLKHKLLLPAPWLKRIELPNPNKSLIRIFEQDSFLKKMKDQLQSFLNEILENEELNKSEAVYEFLVTLPDIVKNSLPQVKKSSKFSLIHFFKSSQGSGQEDSLDDGLLFLDEVDSKDDKKDSIAEPLYALVGDLFELKGVFSLFRRTLITFVQLSFGKTINKQLRETVSWISSEPMLHYYLQLFRDSLWAKNVTKDSTKTELSDSIENVEQTREEKEKIRNEAKSELLKHVPEVLKNFVGHQNSRIGMAKVFEALQDIRLNKQLFYDMLEAFIYEFAPELRPE